MSHPNALDQVTLSVGDLTLMGFSIAGLATYVQVPELDVCFDMGECHLSSLSRNHVFLTHAHGDHARCLPRHWHLRAMLGNPAPATYFLPEAIRASCLDWIRAEARFEGVDDEHVTLPNLIGLEASGELRPLPKRPDLLVLAFEVNHTIPSLGYTLLSKKQKLRAEYRSLSGAEIARLRKQGVEVTRDEVSPRVTFIGDCDGKTLIKQAHIWRSPVLIIEATFLAPGEQALAEQRLHTHISEIAQALERFGDQMAVEHLVLKHFSMRYDVREIPALVASAIPPRFHDKTKLLLAPTSG